MAGLGQHIRIRLADDRVIAPTPAQRRIAARVVLEQGRDADLLSLGLADTHLHGTSACEEDAAQQLARRIDLLELLGAAELAPADGPVDALAEAALAAACLQDLQGRSAEVQRARRALMAVAGALPLDALAALLQVSRRTLFNLRGEQPDPQLVRAIRAQLGLLAQRRAARDLLREPFLIAPGSCE